MKTFTDKLMENLKKYRIDEVDINMIKNGYDVDAVRQEQTRMNCKIQKDAEDIDLFKGTGHVEWLKRILENNDKK